jgi:hypothetical protein
MKQKQCITMLAVILVFVSAMVLWETPIAEAASSTDVMTYQAESYETPAKSSASFAHQTTGATFSRFDASGMGAYAVYTLPADQAGYYDLTIHYRRHESTGVADFYLNGVKQTTGFDNTAGSSYNTYYDCVIRVFLERGDNELKFIITGMGATGYKLNIDYFKLTRITPSIPSNGVFEAENNERQLTMHLPMEH